MPLPADAAQNRDHEDYNIVGKLRPGVSLQQAQAEMDTITARLRQDHPEVYPPNGGLTFGIVPLMEQVVGDVRRTLVSAAGSGGIRAADCLRECGQPAIVAHGGAAEGDRGALGAGRHARPASLRQLLTESVLLALCGGALGLLLAYVGMHWIRVLGPQSVPRLSDVEHRRDRAAVHLHHLGGVGDAVWPGAGGTGVGD